MSTKPTEGPRLTRMIGDPLTGTELPLSQNPSEDSTLATVSPPSLGPQGNEFDEQLTVRRSLFTPRLPPSPTVSPILAVNGSPATTPSSPAHPETKLDVLVVDDDPLTRKLMNRMLSRLGCTVTTAENGQVALDLIVHGTPQLQITPSSDDTGSTGLSLEYVPGTSTANGIESDECRYAVVFLDNQMPVLSGLEMVVKLRAMGRRDFVVGVTGNALLSDQQEYLDAGVDQ